MADNVDATLPSAMSGFGPTAIVPVHNRNDNTVELDLSAKVSTIRLSDALTLTPDLWANIYGYARYEDCLRAFTVCKSFLTDVIPRIKEIAVFDPRALKVGPARRFTGVKSVVIACLYADPPDAPPLPERPASSGYDISTWHEVNVMTGKNAEIDTLAERTLVVDPTVVGATVPFISVFPLLGKVDLVRYVFRIDTSYSDDQREEYFQALSDPSSRYVHITENRYFDDNWDVILFRSKSNDVMMRILMVSIGGAYASGALRSTVYVRGILNWEEGPINELLSSYCTTFVGYDPDDTQAVLLPEEPSQCMCEFYLSTYPMKEAAQSVIHRGNCGCLGRERCIEILLRRDSFQAYLLSMEFLADISSRAAPIDMSLYHIEQGYDDSLYESLYEEDSSSSDAEIDIMEMFRNRVCIASILPTLRSLYSMLGGVRPRISRAEIRVYYAEFFGDLDVEIDHYTNKAVDGFVALFVKNGLGDLL